MKNRHGFSMSGRKTERKENMGAFLGEFIMEVIRMLCLMVVAGAAIFCGKKLRDRKDAKEPSKNE